MRVAPRFLACLMLALSTLLVAPAQAQTPPGGTEKRIALVVGNAAYQAGALATPANDAGLVAQTLQAAGFDVVGARDLDEDALRRALRDFTDKAAASGPDTVAFVYLAGYGLQLNGENYFAPVDARIDSAQDVPVQALRISDYKRRLAALPLKARFFVLDAGRSAPFVKSGDPLAGGLALTDAEPGSLVAFNAAPGTVGPEEKGPYGAYAQSLVEMIREGGLPPADLFERVRLRVSETTKGAEVPWNASKLDTAFVFFQRAADAPPLDDPAKVGALRSRPLRDLGARDAYSACLQRDTIDSYQDFVSAYPRDAMAKRVRVLIAARREALTWRRTSLADNADGYWSYLSRYPRGPNAWDARRRLRELAVALEPPPRFAYLDYDLPPPPPEEIVYVERPAVYFADPYYDLPPPPPVYFLPPPPAYIVDLAPPPPVYLAYALPVPAFVPVPVYVSPPPYIAAPPNNVYFQNIHNTTMINEINRQTIIESQGPQGAPHGPPHGPSIGAVGAGAAAGALLGAAASRVALPPSVAQKAALLPNRGPNNGLAPGGPGGPPGGMALRPGPFGGPTPPNGQPAIPGVVPGQAAPAAAGIRPGFGQPLPGQNGQPLPQQANRPGLPGQIPPGRNPAAGQAPPGPNGLPQQAARPAQPGQIPMGNPATGPVPPGPNGLPQQANRPGQPPAGLTSPNRPAIGQPLPRQNGPSLPQQVNRPGRPPTGPSPDAGRQQAIQAQQAVQQRAAAQAQQAQQRQMMQQQRAGQAAAQQQAGQQRQMMMQQQQAQQRQMMQQQAAVQQRAAAQAQQQQAMQQRQMMQQQQQAQQRQMMQQQAMQQRQMMAPRPQPQAPPPHGGGCRPGLPCR